MPKASAAEKFSQSENTKLTEKHQNSQKTIGILSTFAGLNWFFLVCQNYLMVETAKISSSDKVLHFFDNLPKSWGDDFFGKNRKLLVFLHFCRFQNC